jgi:hypothetical protein
MLWKEGGICMCGGGQGGTGHGGSVGGGSNAHSLSENLCVPVHDWSPLSIRADNLRVLSNHLHSLSMGERRISEALLPSTHSQQPCQATKTLGA